MKIFIWTSFAILIEQAICFPGFDFGSLTNDPGVSEDFLNDLKNLVSETGLAEDDKSLQEMLNGLLNLDLSQAPQNNPAGNTKTPAPIHSLSLGVPELADPNHPLQAPNISSSPESSNTNQIPPNISSQWPIHSENSPSEIKSLTEWIQLDRMNRLGLRRQQKTPSLTEENVQQPPSSAADVLNTSTEVAQPVPQNQPIQSDLGVGQHLGHFESPSVPEAGQNLGHLESPVSVPEAVHPNVDWDDDLDDAKFVEWLTSTSDTQPAPEDKPDYPEGQATSTATDDHGYVSSASWIQHTADQNESQHEVVAHDDDEEDDELSSSWLSKLRDWSSFINPFA